MKSKRKKILQNNIKVLQKLNPVEKKDQSYYIVPKNTKNTVTHPSGLNCRQRARLAKYGTTKGYRKIIKKELV